MHHNWIGTVAIYANLRGQIGADSIVTECVGRADISASSAVPGIDSGVGAGFVAGIQARHAGAGTIDAGHSQRADVST